MKRLLSRKSFIPTRTANRNPETVTLPTALRRCAAAPETRTQGRAVGRQGSMSARRLACVLAVGATTTALCLSVLARWQRGGTLPERLIWIAIGMVLVSSAQLLPALIREMPMVVRGVGSVLGCACLLAACFGHAVFFTLAQQHAGELRAATVQMTSVPESARSLTAVMAERATVTAQLAVAQARNCIGNCTMLRSRRVTLAPRLDVLNAEADDLRRQQVMTNRVTAQHDALLVYPVTSGRGLSDSDVSQRHDAPCSPEGHFLSGASTINQESPENAPRIYTG